MSESIITVVFLWIVALLLIYKLIDRLLRLPTISVTSRHCVLITGASRGLGYEAVRRLDSLGCHVFAGVRTEESREKLRSLCSSRVDPVILDVTDPESIRKARQYVESKLTGGKELWGIINNAGITAFSRIEWLRVDDYEKIMRTNFYGLVDVTMTFLPLLKRSRGRVVNISSGAGRFSNWIFAHYNASKYAVEAFSDSLRRSLLVYGVKVLLIEPGLFKTEMTSADYHIADVRQTWNQTSDEIKEEFGSEYLQKIEPLIGTLMDRASDRIGDVIDAYQHALFGRFPRHRYVIGNTTKYIMIPLHCLPEWFSDFFVNLLFPCPLPAALSAKKRN